MTNVKCPHCEFGVLTVASASRELRTCTCSNCPRLSMLEKHGGVWTLVINGVAVASGVTQLLEYFEIDRTDLEVFFDL